MKRNNPAKLLRFAGNDSNDLRPASRNRSFRSAKNSFRFRCFWASPTPETQRPAAFCVSSPTRAALARARAQGLVGEDQGGGSRHPTRQGMSGAFDALPGPRDPPPKRASLKNALLTTGYARPHIGRPEGRPSLDGLWGAGALTPSTLPKRTSRVPPSAWLRRLRSRPRSALGWPLSRTRAAWEVLPEKLRKGGAKPLKSLARANLCVRSRPIPDQGSRQDPPRPAPGRLRAPGRPSRSARAP